jgi:hypothetical protein
VIPVVEDEQARAERRAFIRDHHPDHGGDPDEFIAGLNRLDGRTLPPPPAGDRVEVYRSRGRTTKQWIRRFRKRLTGTPPRNLQ